MEWPLSRHTGVCRRMFGREPDYVLWRRWCFFSLLYNVRGVIPNARAAFE